MKLYGIKNCNSVKKAIDFLHEKDLDFEFLDIKKIGQEILSLWLKQKSFEELINSAGLTAKKLGLNKEKIKNLNNKELEKIILDNPSCIKRPVIEYEKKIYIGKEYEVIL
ncbi:ArsC family transcriptional regulator [Campylobacter hepaticus]|uniref:ArsC family transcriptional regulator n=1 Tax=Campylobacter hepaticus TaxID=1813019 RepID=A0A6A7JRP0_9BACT|nr:ArsC/Spx/MgsR family protein [Campylobacter hepaticus]AXP08701.1 ArsC family transcriptional regulator [Campylobacter hepaticus]MCZ0772549.1 ArsC family transcriptional regulator [Campylobacter hepaticus]MCZ0774017.1 ArsC family transcriptional regulator [Campylobacter hepaticus]MCZ0775269.1 ArsC family transcriptional regulator [Campylobacter hepaticus]MDX2322981.1 ArsC family transcriptional regulator [Campylobacter hepaticus]